MVDRVEGEQLAGSGNDDEVAAGHAGSSSSGMTANIGLGSRRRSLRESSRSSLSLAAISARRRSRRETSSQAQPKAQTSRPRIRLEAARMMTVAVMVG